jgi:glycosyltransferase involved in cell wall biosynthesis
MPNCLVKTHRPLKLLWIHDRARGTGGAERYITQVAEALRAYNIESCLLYGPGYSEPDFLNVFSQAWPALETSSQILKLQPDLIYVHRLPEGLALSDLLDLGIPVMRFFHDHQLLCLREHKYTALSQQTCTRPLGNHCYTCPGFFVRQNQGVALRTVGQLKRELEIHKGLAQAIVASEYLSNHLFEHGFAKKQISVLPLFAQAAAIDAVKPAHDPWQLLFAGQLVTGKGLDLLLRALVEVPQAKLLIAGDGRQASKYQQLSVRLGLSERVTFLGTQSAEQLSQLQSQVSMLVIPSRAPETFALAGVEAMAHGKAVIASDVGGMRSWLTPGSNGLLFPSGDVASLADCIRQLGQAPEQAQAMGLRGYYDWQKRFQIEQHLDKLVPLLYRLLPVQPQTLQIKFQEAC